MTLYRVVLADPPWSFSAWNEKTAHRHVSKQYDTLSLEAICTMSPPTLEDAALFLWATWPNIQSAFVVIEAWGFEYKTLAFDWIKLNTASPGFHMGMGYYTRANPEPCLLGIKGRMADKVKSRSVRALTLAPRGAHSEKPETVYRKIETLFDGPYLEMFARSPRVGWDAFGNEVANSISLP